MSKALESLFSACEELEASDVHVMAGRRIVSGVLN